MGEEKIRILLAEEWRRVSIPCWRRILQESIQGKDQRREAYARYMLGGVLADPEYKGPWQPPEKFKFTPEPKKELVDGEV
jgi:hypothetical protein